VNDDSIREIQLARTDAIGAWVCSLSVIASVVLVVIYAVKD
jgi:hypothetical protein